MREQVRAGGSSALISIVVTGVVLALSVQAGHESEPATSAIPCNQLELGATPERSQYSVDKNPVVIVSLENLSDVPVVIRKDKVASTRTIEEIDKGEWKEIMRTGLGRGTGDLGAKAPEPTREEAVKWALEDHVMLAPGEGFSVRDELRASLFGSETGEATNRLRPGRFRVSYFYWDDLYESTPVAGSPCRLVSNSAEFFIASNTN